MSLVILCPEHGPLWDTNHYEERATFEMAILRAIHHGFKLKVRELRKPSRA